MTNDTASSSGRNARSAARRRVRLRPIKIVTHDHRFIEDASGVDLSDGGLRVRRFTDRRLPESFVVFDEGEGTFRPVVVAWTGRHEMGLQFKGPASLATRTEMLRLTSRYYAVGN